MMLYSFWTLKKSVQFGHWCGLFHHCFTLDVQQHERVYSVMACQGFHQIHKKTDTTITTKITVGQLFINETSTEKKNWKEKKYHRLPLEQSRKSFHQNKILNWSHFQPGSKSRSRCSDRRQLLGKKLQHWSDRCRRSAEPWCTTVLSNCSLSGKSPDVWLLPFQNKTPGV